MGPSSIASAVPGPPRLDNRSRTMMCAAPCAPRPGKTHAELVELEGGIQEQLDSGAAADPEYWSAVLARLAVHKARAQLREMHAEFLHRHNARCAQPCCCRKLKAW